MILPRSSAGRNADGIAFILLVALLGGCTHRLGHPPNVTIHDAHTVGHRLAFNRASDTLASAGSEGRVRLWRLPDGQSLAEWKAHEGSIYGLLFLDREQLVLSAGHDGTLALWENNGRLRERRATGSPVTDLAGDGEARLVISGHADGAVRIWQLPELALVATQRRHAGAVRAVAFHPETQGFASSGRDGRVYVWRGNEPARELPAPPGDAHQLAFSPDGRILTGSGWFRLYRWSLAEPATLTVLPTAHWGAISALQYTHDGTQIATISRETDSAVDLLDARTGAVTRRFLPHDLCGAYVRLSPDGRYLATTSDDASVRLWDLLRLRAPQ
jgi:WD40 repeat protein